MVARRAVQTRRIGEQEQQMTITEVSRRLFDFVRSNNAHSPEALGQFLHGNTATQVPLSALLQTSEFSAYSFDLLTIQPQTTKVDKERRTKSSCFAGFMNLHDSSTTLIVTFSCTTTGQL
jgi:hypothetical protein